MPNKKKCKRKTRFVAGEEPVRELYLLDPGLATALPFYAQHKWTLPAIFSEAIKSSFDSPARWDADVRGVADVALERGLVLWLHVEPSRVAETVADISRNVLRNICATYDSTTETLAVWDREPEPPEDEDEAQEAHCG